MTKGPKPRPLAERIADRVVTTDSGCVEWRGATRNGYGVIGIGSRSDDSRRVARVHRLAYEIVHGPIDDPKIFVCHHCDNPLCCNVDHLFLGSPADNTADMDSKGRRISTGRPGSANGRAKLDPESVREIRDLRRQGVTLRVIAIRFGVGLSSVSAAARGETWTEVA